MPRVLGVDIPNEKPTYISLTYLLGVGNVRSIEICRTLGLNPQRRARELSEDDIQRINSLLDGKYVVEGQLRRQTADHIGRLKSIQCYRGIRHRKGLPVRGQNTQSNARTRKGVKKTVAGKKGVKDARH
ncbi:30S ribosomal protein S13 [Planctomicrobium piriforme]|uniref:Small ribosomal subunit protein uS13 n=1 Tax=Planctomicrobium piriforme TaxID=1576369 RepID=A0A1I3KYS2_9PLAN|nr:30S ribosomal protein S13 [Planctomicrobium piriforme]SFI77681.1 small subunit ribosomal protein S13 [Planctomicrobium piriforme]